MSWTCHFSSPWVSRTRAVRCLEHSGTVGRNRTTSKTTWHRARTPICYGTSNCQPSRTVRRRETLRTASGMGSKMPGAFHSVDTSRIGASPQDNLIPTRAVDPTSARAAATAHATRHAYHTHWAQHPMTNFGEPLRIRTWDGSGRDQSRPSAGTGRPTWPPVIGGTLPLNALEQVSNASAETSATPPPR